MNATGTSGDLPHLVLASKSPRRREIVCALEARVETADSGFPEDSPAAGEPPERFARRLAEGKARAVGARRQSGVVIGADTIVVIDGEVLGKPASEDEAAGMLVRLRGRTHHVFTAVCVLDSSTGRSVTGVADTAVTMRNYTDREVADYVASGEPMDKAGAGGVHDGGFDPAERVEGCYLNVVGLPLCVTGKLLERLGTPVRVRPDWTPPDGFRPCEFAAPSTRNAGYDARAPDADSSGGAPDTDSGAPYEAVKQGSRP